MGLKEFLRLGERRGGGASGTMFSISIGGSLGRHAVVPRRIVTCRELQNLLRR